MIRIIAGLSRSFPLVIALVVLAVVIYFVVAWRRSPARAKEILIKVFVVLCSAIAVFFTLASLYAVVDDNIPVLELAASFAVVGVVGLIITLICRYVFKKNNPHYKQVPTAKAKTIENKPDLLSAVTKILNFINDHRNKP